MIPWITAEGFSPVVKDQWELTQTRIREWLTNELLSPNWWILLALFLFNLFLWWKLAQKRRFSELIFFTSVIIIWVIVLDELGEEISLWYYTVNIFPLFPPMTAIDLSCLPLIYMLMHQYTRTWKSFLITLVLASAVFCFVFEPIFLWSGVYRLLTWKVWYGLPIYIFIGVVTRFVTSHIFGPPAIVIEKASIIRPSGGNTTQ